MLFIADEVMTGFGRTGRQFGIEHWGVRPDLIACAKGISGGYAPLGAVIVTPEIVGEVRGRGKSLRHRPHRRRQPALLRHRRGRPALRPERTTWSRNAAEVGAYFLERLRDMQERQPIVGDVRGIGLLLGVEFVRDRATKEPFPAAWQVSRRVGKATLERGLVSYPMTGTVDGVLGDHLLYAPPLTITRAQIDELVGILDASLRRSRRTWRRSRCGDQRRGARSCGHGRGQRMIPPAIPLALPQEEESSPTITVVITPPPAPITRGEAGGTNETTGPMAKMATWPHSPSVETLGMFEGYNQ